VRRRVLLGAVSATAASLSGCTGLLGGGGGETPVEVSDRDCGEFGGIDGCRVTLSNPTESEATATLTVEALDDSGATIDSNSQSYTLAAGEETTVSLGVGAIETEVAEWSVSVN
jgi:hypothetical protein